jgi:hypothetical protein
MDVRELQPVVDYAFYHGFRSIGPRLEVVISWKALGFQVDRQALCTKSRHVLRQYWSFPLSILSLIKASLR